MLSSCLSFFFSVPQPLVVSMPTFFSFTVNWNRISTTVTFSLLLNKLPRLSFQPVFSLGSLPGKQEKHLNQWKMCLMLLGSTAAILQRYKTLQPRQLETTDRTALMKPGVKCGSNERKEGLIRVSQRGLYDVFYLHAQIRRRTWKSWGDRITFRCRWEVMLGGVGALFYMSTMTFQLPAWILACPREGERSTRVCQRLLAYLSAVGRMGGRGCCCSFEHHCWFNTHTNHTQAFSMKRINIVCFWS